jgi:hypothetical protein
MIGHVDVRDDQVELAARQLAEAIDAVLGLGDLELLDAREGEHQELTHHGGIFDD